MTAIEKYIFKDGTGDHFIDVFKQFHDQYVERLMMVGLCESTDESIEDVKMSKMLNSQKTCEKIIGGITSQPPCVYVNYDDDIWMEVVHIPTYVDEPGYYMLQAVNNWPGEGGDTTCMQIWKLNNKTTLEDINNHWR